MQFDNCHAVLEISSSSLKLVLGYVFNKQIVVALKKSIPLINHEDDRQIINGGVIDEKYKKLLAQKISEILKFDEKDTKIKGSIKELVLIIPPIGMNCYESTRKVNVVSQNLAISERDMNNLYEYIRGLALPRNDFIVDAIPDYFVLDGQHKVAELPLGKQAKYFMARCKIHCLPKDIVKNYRSVVSASGARAIRTIIAPYSMAKFLATRQNVTGKVFIYIDHGCKITTVTLVSCGSVIKSSHFLKGGDILTNLIAEKFKISYEDAEKIKIKYGYDSRALSFSPELEVNDNDGNLIKFTIKDLNEVIKEYFDEFVYSLNNCMQTLLKNLDDKCANLPLVIGGGASKLHGFFDYLKGAFGNRKIIKVPLDVIGIRDQVYLNAAGAIIAASTYNGTLQDSLIEERESASRNDITGRRIERHSGEGDNI